MFNLFREYGKVVKYSHMTMIKNPSMIDREYRYKIDKLKFKIHDAKEKVELPDKYRDYLFEEVLEFEKDGDNVFVDNEKLYVFIENVKNHTEKIDDLRINLHELELEYGEFNKNLIKNGVIINER